MKQVRLHLITCCIFLLFLLSCNEASDAIHLAKQVAELKAQLEGAQKAARLLGDQSDRYEKILLAERENHRNELQEARKKMAIVVGENSRLSSEISSLAAELEKHRDGIQSIYKR